jgi:hypothetical protein
VSGLSNIGLPSLLLMYVSMYVNDFVGIKSCMDGAEHVFFCSVSFLSILCISSVFMLEKCCNGIVTT